jgi:hypothetical protein
MSHYIVNESLLHKWICARVLNLFLLTNKQKWCLIDLFQKRYMHTNNIKVNTN